jgi:hypothetical protein
VVSFLVAGMLNLADGALTEVELDVFALQALVLR